MCLELEVCFQHQGSLGLLPFCFDCFLLVSLLLYCTDVNFYPSFDIIVLNMIDCLHCYWITGLMLGSRACMYLLICFEQTVSSLNYN